MQATFGTTRFALGQMKVMAIGLGILASAAVAGLGIATLDNSPASSSKPATTGARTVQEPESYVYQEQNQFLPNQGDPATNDRFDGIAPQQSSRIDPSALQSTHDRFDGIAPQPWNSSIAPAIQPADLTVFIEQNTQFPTAYVATPVPGDDR